MDHELGSLEAGKRADVVVVDTSGPNWVTRSPDPVLQLLWASDGRDVRHVVASGRVVVARSAQCTTVDLRGAGRRGPDPPAPILPRPASIRARLAGVGLIRSRRF